METVEKAESIQRDSRHDETREEEEPPLEEEEVFMLSGL